MLIPENAINSVVHLVVERRWGKWKAGIQEKILGYSFILISEAFGVWMS